MHDMEKDTTETRMSCLALSITLSNILDLSISIHRYGFELTELRMQLLVKAKIRNQNQNNVQDLEFNLLITRINP